MTGLVAAGATSKSGDPYPGPRPFQSDETELFFGRDREQSQLRSLVVAHSLVMLYAQSGAGKTSLLRAGLVPSLEERDVTVYPPIRIRPSGPDAAAAGIRNPYVRQLVANWAAEAGERDLPELHDLSDFVAHLARRYDAPEDEPRVLILDQFEEIFTFFPESWESRADFFVQVDRALAADVELRVLLSLREDYLPQTDPYAGLVPNRLQHRFRIERLRKAAALEAVKGPLVGTSRTFAPEAAEYLVDQLLQIRIERTGSVDQVPGEYVEPVQLQIVCASLWERLEELPKPVTRIEREHIDRYAQVDRALARFYGDVIGRVATATGLDPLELRRWCEVQLITAGGTRALVYRGSDATEGIDNAVIDALESEHLIRGEARAGAHWYELSHDKFVEAIQTGNRRAFEQHSEAAGALGEQANEWNRQLTFGIGALGSMDDKTRREGLSALYPVLARGVPIAPDLVKTVQAALEHVAVDRNASDDVRRDAESLRLLMDSSTAERFDEYGLRRTAAYVRRKRVRRSPLLQAAGLLLLLMLASAIGVFTVSDALWSLWRPVPDVGASIWLSYAALATVWTLIYVWDTFENFPIDFARRSESQFVHTMKAPIGPYLDWIDAIELAGAWPFNLLLPVAGATGLGLVAVEIGWAFAAVFFPALVLGTLLAVAAYVESQI
jgi:hypothetical protein